jgi:hypothetical protein
MVTVHPTPYGRASGRRAAIFVCFTAPHLTALSSIYKHQYVKARMRRRQQKGPEILKEVLTPRRVNQTLLNYTRNRTT